MQKPNIATVKAALQRAGYEVSEVKRGGETELLAACDRYKIRIYRDGDLWRTWPFQKDVNQVLRDTK